MFLNSCFITEEKIHKKLEGSPSPEAELSPAAKDQVDMYVSALSKPGVFAESRLDAAAWSAGVVCRLLFSLISCNPGSMYRTVCVCSTRRVQRL